VRTLIIASVALVASGLAASAADLRRPAPVAAMSPVPMAYNWNGFYVGGHIGGGWQSGDSTLLGAPAPLFFPLGTTIGGDGSGFLGGLQVGYNYQVNPNWLIGIEGDISWTNTNFSVTSPSTLIPGSSVTTTVNVDYYATLTGRLGYVANNWLFYMKGGAAWMDVTYGGSAIGPAAIINPLSDTRLGWTIGAGVENGFAPNWSWKLEYNYLDFSSETYSFTTTPAFGVTTNSVDTQVHLFKAGINYRFGF
jgi:outer membrane immunogenic protein